MDSKTATIKVEDLSRLLDDIELIKNILISEGELTPWARRELEEARKVPHSENVPLEEVERRLQAR